jgi:hypothetical protein
VRVDLDAGTVAPSQFDWGDDAALPISSFGVRLALRGELALSDAWALVAQVGLRTAEHLLEIGVLPTLAVGVRVRL